MLSVK